MKYDDHLFARLPTKQAERMLDNIVLILNSVQAMTEENHIEPFLVAKIPLSSSRRREDFTTNGSSPLEKRQLASTSRGRRPQ